MHENSILQELFSKLTDSETKSFGLFLESPYFNRNTTMIMLYEYLLACKVAKQEPDPVCVHKKLWPDKPFHDSRIRSANSDLHDLLEQFLACEDMFGKPNLVRNNLINQYRTRKADKNFKATLRKIQTQSNKSPHRHAEYYTEQLETEWSLYRRMATEKRTEKLNLQTVSDTMDLAFVAQKLRLICLAISHQSVYTTTYDTGLFDSVMDYIRQKNLVEIPAIGLYYHCYIFLTDPNDNQSFNTFNALISTHADLFPDEELRAFYLLAINYGIQHINKGQSGWEVQTFQLYQAALSRRLLLEDGVLSRFAFNNIVAVGLRTGHTDWTEQFILQYRTALDRTYREVTFSLNMARVAYVKKDYETALKYLQKSDYKDLINNFIVKILQIKIYYELQEFNLLSSHLDSMQNYMRRKAAIGYHREAYRLLILYTRRLMTVNQFSKSEKLQLTAAIHSEKGLIEKAWFLEQIAAL